MASGQRKTGATLRGEIRLKLDEIPHQSFIDRTFGLAGRAPVRQNQTALIGLGLEHDLVIVAEEQSELDRGVMPLSRTRMLRTMICSRPYGPRDRLPLIVIPGGGALDPSMPPFI